MFVAEQVGRIQVYAPGGSNVLLGLPPLATVQPTATETTVAPASNPTAASLTTTATPTTGA